MNYQEMYKQAMIKGIIKSSGSKIVRVSFEKKDGSIRHMQINPKYCKGLVKEYKSESTEQSVKTRKANNPNLINVMDLGLRRKGTEEKKCWRSVNMNTVISIKAGGILKEFDL